MDVTSKLSLPCPFQTQNWKEHGRPNFQATPSTFSKSIQLLHSMIFKQLWCHQPNVHIDATLTQSPTIALISHDRILYRLPFFRVDRHFLSYKQEYFYFFLNECAIYYNKINHFSIKFYGKLLLNRITIE